MTDNEQLLKMQADYKSGKISKEKYDSYHKALSEYEEVN